jgi:hypothetical protein
MTLKGIPFCGSDGLDLGPLLGLGSSPLHLLRFPRANSRQVMYMLAQKKVMYMLII